ncbi:F0F1 ATP synthase subunit B family protein [Erythrobacter sp. BLCC-B19]|uniref:F0F1 ATP synthase subunit B family protein n=1 Tax=Erythrobacter sp. BLCC-B19 TaxID=3025315 RepID=UPI0023604CB6|nr:ATPase [Erythrobacter sp. BLCC-B19]WDA40400.1 ATPase [Erythrobacter sp. BLCC-B19]
MPQIDQISDFWSSQVFWLLVFFGLTFLIVGLGMVPKVMGTVDLRDNQIAGDLAAAQAARDEATAQEEAWRKRENANRAAAQGLIGEAKAKAAAANAARLAEAQGRLDAQLAEADAAIAAARTSAMAEIEGVAAEAAREIVARVAGAAVEPAAAEAAVKEVMAHG